MGQSRAMQARTFAERVLQIKPVSSGVLLNSGISGATLGATTGGSELVVRVHRQAIGLAKLLHAAQPDMALAEQQAHDIEASLRSMQVFGVLSDKEAESYLHGLDQLITAFQQER